MSEVASSTTLSSLSDRATVDAVLRQVARVAGDATGLQVSVSGQALVSSDPPGEGIESISALVAEGVVVMRVELLKAPARAQIDLNQFFRQMSELGDACRIARPPDSFEGQDSPLFMDLFIDCSPLTLARETAITSTLARLDGISRLLKAGLPRPVSDADAARLYKDLSEHVRPVAPWNDPVTDMVASWAEGMLDLIDGATPVAVCAADGVAGDFCLSVIARLGRQRGRILGRVIAPIVTTRGLLELATRAPGPISLIATRLSMGSSPYELASEVRGLLSSLRAAGRPVLFTGTFPELQQVFSGGQGGGNDPLEPVVARVPEVPDEDLARFAIRDSAGRLGGLSRAAEDRLLDQVMAGLASVPPGKRAGLVRAVASRTASLEVSGRAATAPSAECFVETLSSKSETFAGLAPRPRAGQPPDVQAAWVRALRDPGLLDFLRERLLGQNRALAEVVVRLTAEVLTRPDHQPVRICFQGTPGTGKSESAALLAQYLGIPYVNFDAASPPDLYSAKAQLEGSGRGIVGSHQAGRLEQCAKHHQGCVLEVSDIDHASPQVASGLGDIFLQCLETGEAQSATGTLFSAASVIFVFSINGPGGADEQVRKRLGFGDPPSPGEVTARVSEVIKNMLSSAFLSRIGTPIVFDPLEGKALALIEERAVERAARTAAGRLGIRVNAVEIEPSLGEWLVSTAGRGMVSHGARGLLEIARSHVAVAMAGIASCEGKSGVLRLERGEGGGIRVSLL